MRCGSRSGHRRTGAAPGGLSDGRRHPRGTTPIGHTPDPGSGDDERDPGILQSRRALFEAAIESHGPVYERAGFYQLSPTTVGELVGVIYVGFGAGLPESFPPQGEWSLSAQKQGTAMALRYDRELQMRSRFRFRRNPYVCLPGLRCGR